jgi:PAS domain S-box-containing protein
LNFTPTPQPHNQNINRLSVELVPALQHLISELASLAMITLEHTSALVFLNQPNGYVVVSNENHMWSLPLQPIWNIPSQARSLEAKELETVAQDGLKSNFFNGVCIAINTGSGNFGMLWLLNSKQKLQDFSVLQRVSTIFATALKWAQSFIATTRQHDLAFAVADSLPIGLVVADLTGRIQFINRAYTSQFGYLPQDLKDRNLAELALPEHRKQLHKALKQRQNGESSTYRYQMYRRDGSIADVEMNGTPYKNTNGQLVGKVAIAKDISEELALERATHEARRAIHKKMTDTLLETRRSLEDEKNFAFEMIESLQEGFALLDLNAHFRFTNSAFAQLCAMSAQALVGLSAESFIEPEDLEAVRQHLYSVRPGQSVSFVHRIRQANLNVLHVKARVSLHLNQAGNVAGILLAAKDISSEVESSQKMHQLKTELQSMQAKMQSGTGFFGRLESIGGAVNLVQMLHASGMNGAIQLDDSIIFLAQGRFVAVNHPKLSGLAALEAMIQRERGQFQFIPGIQPEKVQFSLDPIQLALEWSTRKDEIFAPTPMPHEQQVVLPNAKAALAFMQGVGGRSQFTLSTEQGNVILLGRGIKVVVLDAKPEDF